MQATLDPSMVSATKQLPPPLVKFGKHPIQFIKNRLLLIIYAVLFAYIGTLMVAATYYLLFEITTTMNNWWHDTVSNGNLRHSIRDVGEGLLGGLLAQHIVRNRYKKLNKPIKLNALDRLEIRLHIANVKDDKRLSFGQLLATPLLVLVYGSVGFFASLWFIDMVRHSGHLHDGLSSFFTWLLPLVHSNLSHHSLSYMQKVQVSLTDAWPNKLTGYMAAFLFGRRPAKGVFDDMQLWFCEQRLLRYQTGEGKFPWYEKALPGFLKRHIKPMSKDLDAPAYYPPTWKATYNDAKLDPSPDAVYHPILAVAVVPIMLLAGACLAGYGFYVLTFIATS